MATLQVGKAAPDFTLEGVSGKEFLEVSLSQYRGKWVVLFFYPLDFTFVCPTEIIGFNENYEKFTKFNAEILGASVDSKFSHLAWISQELGDLRFPLLSDITKEVARNYGILIEEQGISLRGLYIIDPQGVLRYELVHDLNVGRSVDETLRVLEALQTGELCPLNWRQGVQTLGKG
ncbi:MAG: peroxiredoxin [Syntrophotaleaceae bacterium]